MSTTNQPKQAPLIISKNGNGGVGKTELTAILATVLGRTKNQLAIAGHVRGFPEMLVENPTWSLSDQRAHAARLRLLPLAAGGAGNP